MKRALGSGLAGLIIVLGVVVGVARAQSIGGNGGGGGGGLSQSAADLLYCALAGCTMTGATTYSGIANDIATGTNEDLRLRPNGTGRVRLQSGDNTYSWETSTGTATTTLELSGTTARLFTSSSAGIYFGTDGTGGTQVGVTNAASATNPVGAFSEAVSSATTGTPVFSGYGAGKFGTRQPQTCTCVANAGAGGTLGGVTCDLQSSVVWIANPDADGCIVTISETSGVVAVDTRIVVVSNAGGVVTFPNVANVHAGPAAATTTGLGVNDSYAVHYADAADDLYVGVSHVDN